MDFFKTLNMLHRKKYNGQIPWEKPWFVKTWNPKIVDGKLFILFI